MSRKRKNERTFVKIGKDRLSDYYASSPYWDSLFKGQGKNEDGTLQESKFSNPDISEEGSLSEFYRQQAELRDRKDNLKYLLQVAIHNCGLADQERVVIQRVIYDRVPAVDVAKELHITKQAVSDAMNRAVEKIKRKMKILTLQHEI